MRTKGAGNHAQETCWTFISQIFKNSKFTTVENSKIQTETAGMCDTLNQMLWVVKMIMHSTFVILLFIIGISGSIWMNYPLN